MKRESKELPSCAGSVPLTACLSEVFLVVPFFRHTHILASMSAHTHTHTHAHTHTHTHSLPMELWSHCGEFCSLLCQITPCHRFACSESCLEALSGPQRQRYPLWYLSDLPCTCLVFLVGIALLQTLINMGVPTWLPACEVCNGPRDWWSLKK
jgi:hypothetical protein